MKMPSDRRRRIVTRLLIAGLVILCAVLFAKVFIQTVREALAEEQIQTIQLCRDQALNADVVGAANQLHWAVSYYPSGTKQSRGTLMDRIVETQRKRAVADIIARLRELTGENLSDEPEAWVSKYSDLGVSRSQPASAPGR